MPSKTSKPSKKKVCKNCRITFMVVVLLALIAVLGFQMYANGMLKFLGISSDSGLYISADGGINPGSGMFPDGPPNVEPPVSPPPSHY